MNRAAALLALASLAGCAAKPALTSLRTVRVEASADANFLSGTRIDLVFALTPEARAALPPSADLWFAAAPTLRDGNGGLKVLTVELPADYRATDVALPHGYRKAIAIYSYASYLAPAGLGRCDLTTQVHATLRLQYDHIDCGGR